MLTVVRIISFLFQLYEFLIFIRVLLSWVNPNPYSPLATHPAVLILYRITDPVLEPLRRIIPPIGGMIDLSPMVALLLLELARQIITRSLLGLAF
ncbi:MAG: YggT family protein [Anaerolineae bacterium]|nr:YggT family protein [Anaerolineae bacterium]